MAENTPENSPRGTNMLARERWQVGTIKVLERVFDERVAQMKKHGHAMRDLPGGTGPDVQWLGGDSSNINGSMSAHEIQEEFRWEYDGLRGSENPDGEGGELTRMHLVREELAEAFELEQTDPAFVDEILQVAALCVQWAEYLLEKEREQ